MKPSEINAILDYQEMPDGTPYLRVKEAGEVLSSKVLTWVITYCLGKNINLYWEIEGGSNWIGSPEFAQFALEDTKDKFYHQESSPPHSAVEE